MGLVVIPLILCLVAVYVCYRLMVNTKSIPNGLKELPSMKGIPFFGIYFHLKKPHTFNVKELGKKCGPLFNVRLGMRDFVILNNYDVIIKTLKENGDIFSGRYPLSLHKEIKHNFGIILNDGDMWAKQRSFVMSVLRDFGLGKSRSAKVVQDECLILLEELKKEEGKSVKVIKLVAFSTLNIISKFIMNKRFSKEDKDIQPIFEIMEETVKSEDKITLLDLLFPFIGSSFLFIKLARLFTSRFKNYDNVHGSLKTEIENHLKELDFNSEGKDLMERFLIKQREMKEKTGTVDSFTDWQLIMNAYDLLVAGYETTSTTLEWSCMFMSKFQNIQEKVYLEIVDNVGTERDVTMNDRKSLHYTLAVMDEILRMSSIVPFSIPHRTRSDTVVDQYFIPKDSFISPNLIGCHFDPDVWENPMQFSPERFLVEDDRETFKYSPRKELIPFGIGKRQCLGEALANMEYFIFFTNIMQRFKITSSEQITDKRFEEIIIGEDSFIRGCLSKHFIFHSRTEC